MPSGSIIFCVTLPCLLKASAVVWPGVPLICFCVVPSAGKGSLAVEFCSSSITSGYSCVC